MARVEALVETAGLFDLARNKPAVGVYGRAIFNLSAWRVSFRLAFESLCIILYGYFKDVSTSILGWGPIVGLILFHGLESSAVWVTFTPMTAKMRPFTIMRNLSFMNPFQLSNKLFQKGQTWHECVESWQGRRRLFLERLDQASQLRQTSGILASHVGESRLAVYFSQWSTDALMALPFIGVTLSGQPHVQVRFFSSEFYFPLLHEALGRCTPLLLLLAPNGEAYEVWSQRPEEMQLQDCKQSVEAFLLDYSLERYGALLDAHIARQLKSVFAAKIPPFC